MDTIDIEDFANYVKSSFVTYFSDLMFTTLVAVAPWVSMPVFSTLAKWAIDKIVTFMATQGGLVAFMINTNVFTTDQAKDYVTAIEKLHALPDNVSDQEWETLENEANHNFSNLVRFAA